MSYAFERSVTMPEFGMNEVQDRFGVVGKGELVARSQDLMSLFDSLKLCKFLLYGGVKVKHMLEWFNAVTGFAMSQAEFLKAGERIWNLQRAFNIRMGVSRKDDTLPDRFLKESVNEGPAKGQIVELETMLAEFYNERGLDQNGKPSKDKLLELGLDWVAEKLYPD
jgi:aldehyde:ferredoxin oxidoreductase